MDGNEIKKENKIMSKKTILAIYYDNDTKVEVTVKTYEEEYIEKKEKNKIADFIYHRLYSRYIKPFEYDENEYKTKYKNGFSMMASYCLLIETLQSFKNGWGDSNGKSQQAFKEFFKDNQNFDSLANKGEEIYKNIRCGILHQGETTGGWKIRRDGDSLVDDKTIDAVIFGRKLKKELENYRNKLKDAEWDSEWWDNCRTKMRKIIQNCQIKVK
jgi:hypothetical protein